MSERMNGPFIRSDSKTIEQERRIAEIDAFVDKYYSQEGEGRGMNDPKMHARLALMGAGMDDPLSQNWQSFYKHNEDTAKLLKEKLSGKTLVDLGFGNNFNHLDALKDLGIARYKGVDLMIYNNVIIDDKDFYSRAEEKYKKNNIKAEIIEQDMLKYVARMPDSSANFMLNAIDNYMIKDNQYWKYLIEEIYRTTEPKGIVTGVSAGTISKKFSESGKFKIIEGDSEVNPQELEEYILEKI